MSEIKLEVKEGIQKMTSQFERKVDFKKLTEDELIELVKNNKKYEKAVKNEFERRGIR